jgi:hypothetical protein
MRAYLVIVVLFLVFSRLSAQQWNWAVDAGGGGNTDFCYDIATDSQGNAYWVGSASGTADFGCATLVPGSTIAGVLAKYDANGACQWVVGITTSFYDAWVYGIAIDAQDRIYITGSCQGTTQFGNGIELPGSGSSDDWFTARYDVNGTCVWAKRITNSSGSSEGRGIALDDQGDIYVTGFAGGSSFTFDPVTVNTGGFARQAVIVKYDSTGTAVWARSTIGTGGGKSARAISIANDRLFITGQMSFNNASYDGIALTPNANSGNLYVLACDLQGNGLWARSYGPGDVEGFGIAADTLGNLWVVGRLWGTMELPDTTLASNGNNDDILLLGLGQDGTYRWGYGTGSPQRDLAWGVTADGKGNAYVAMHFQQTIDLFGTPLSALGSEDALIAKVRADGDVVWWSRPSGFQRDIPLCVHRQAAPPHRLFFGGYYFGPITYGGATIDDIGNGDAMMVSGIDTTFDVSTYAAPVCEGACDGVAYAFVNGEAPFTYAWSTGATTSSVAGLCAGNYVVEVTDAGGDVMMDAVLLTEHGPLELFIQVDGDSLWVEGGSNWIWELDGFQVGVGQPYHIALASGTYMVHYLDAYGCMNGSPTIIVVLNVGMDERAISATDLWPNPVADVLYVMHERSTATPAELINSAGQVVRSMVLNTGRNAVDIGALPAGLYVLRGVYGLVGRVMVE